MYANQYFSFLFTDMKFEKVVYEIDEAKILQSTPQEVAIQTMTNNTPITQIMGFDVDETMTDMSTFNFKYYLSITVGATGEAGVFFVADGKVKAVDVTNSFDFTWGKTHLASGT